jgi:hypothetical protein
VWFDITDVCLIMGMHADDSVALIVLRCFFQYLDGEPTVVVTDNGRGMSAKALNDWAIYRLSKFNRRSSNLYVYVSM